MAHILLIEPDVVLGRTYQQALEYAGHSVSLSRSAQQALGAAEKRVPEVVVMELQLAAHSGIEFLHEFRSYSEWQKIPVLVNTHVQPSVTGSTGVGKALRANLGITAVLYKPHTSLKQLVSTVNQQVLPT